MSIPERQALHRVTAFTLRARRVRNRGAADRDTSDGRLVADDAIAAGDRERGRAPGVRVRCATGAGIRRSGRRYRGAMKRAILLACAAAACHGTPPPAVP